MEMINQAFEGADAFAKMMEKLELQKDMENKISLETLSNDERRYSVINSNAKQPHENRAQYRARIKRERRSKAKA